MSKVQLLRALVKQRLAAAVEDIFGLFERTIAEYEEELSRTRDENERQQKFLDAALQRIHIADVQQLLGREEVPSDPEPPHIKEEQQDQEDPEPPHIKEELQGLKEADITKFPFIPVPVKSEDDDDEEEAQSSQLHHMEADGEDSGGPGSAGNSHPGNMIEESSESDTVDSGDWQETRDPQSALRTNEVPDLTGKKPLSCSQCEKCFSRHGNLKIHMRIHTGAKPHSCSFCQKSFRQSGTLRKHMLTHTGEKPHSCSVCQKSFRLSGTLRSHMLTHTGEKPHSCPLCQKSFTVRSNLRKHMVTHTGEKSHSCSVCEKSFTRSETLRRHMLTHTGEKPHRCSACGKIFRANRALEKHMSVCGNVFRRCSGDAAGR